MRAAADVFAERAAVYGTDYLHYSTVLQGLFPDGVGDLTPAQMARLMMICKIVQKLARYCTNLRRGGHADSLDDLAVYAMMCSEMDDRGI